MTRPIGVEKLTLRFIDSLISMGAEIVTLRLKQIRGKHCRAVAVIIGQRRADRRHRNAQLHSRSRHPPPARLRSFDRLFEKGVKQQIHQIEFGVEGFLDFS